MDKGLLSNPGFPGRYDQKRHGSIEDYLTLAKDAHATPEFHGYADYAQLWEKGYLIPDKSVIRLERHYKTLRGVKFVEESETNDYLVKGKKVQGELILEKIGAGTDAKDYAKTILKKHLHSWFALNLAEHPEPGQNYR
jgi:hypothetical protein